MNEFIPNGIPFKDIDKELIKIQSVDKEALNQIYTIRRIWQIHFYYTTANEEASIFYIQHKEKFCTENDPLKLVHDIHTN